MPQYTYTQDDFTATQINLEDLQRQIQNAGLASANVQSLSYSSTESGFDVQIYFDTYLSGTDLTTLDALVAAYVHHAYADSVAIVRDSKSAGTNGGTFIEGVWQTRDLNTVIGDMLFASLADNEITLEPSTYTITFAAPACGVLSHQARLYNVSTSSPAIVASSAFSNSDAMTSSGATATITLEETQTFRIEHICSGTTEDIGFGRATGFDTEEIYTTCTIARS